MDKEKQARLEAAGWKVGDAKSFLGLSEAEQAYIDFQIELGRLIRAVRTEKGMSQADLAQILETSQPRVSRMELGHPSVSLDLQVKALLALGTERQVIASALAPAA